MKPKESKICKACECSVVPMNRKRYCSDDCMKKYNSKKVTLQRILEHKNVENMPNEIWKPVNGYEGHYEISNKGRIKSVQRTIKSTSGDRVLLSKIKPVFIGPHGYMFAHLRKDKKARTIPVHRIIAIAFIPNPEGKPCVNHIDADKTNFHISNLEWVTYKENLHHALKLSKGGNSKLTVEQVIEIRNSKEKNVHLAKKYNVVVETISHIKNNKTWNVI